MKVTPIMEEPYWKKGLTGSSRSNAQRRHHHKVRERRQFRARQLLLGKNFSPKKVHRKNSNLISKRTNGKKTFHRFPVVFDLITNFEETAEWLAALRYDIYVNPVKQVTIDHSLAKRASPEALLVLIAEMTRATEYSPRCKKQLNLPPPGPFLDLAWALGYVQHFRNIPPQPATGTKEYLRYFSGRKTEQRSAVKPLVDHFGPACSFDELTRKALKVAIGECMTNVLLHAYKKESKNLIDQWWLLGYRDQESHEISFCFYDQGQGIPATIRVKWQDRFPVIAPTDSEMIQKGLQGHYSRTGEDARGSGLPTLVEFIDRAMDGELLIFSRKGRYFYRKGQPAKVGDSKIDLPGTLITWKLRT